VRRLAILVAAVVVGYAPFYFDGNYPGGGARLWFDAIAFEQILVAWVAVRLELARFVVPVALLGFAFHASFEHHRLAEREGGRPMFEPDVVARAGVRSGLLFVTTDHGFNLGHAPGATDLVVARGRNDAHDWLLWKALGRPPAFRYEYDPRATSAAAAVAPYQVPPSDRWEAEAEWPPVAVRSGWVRPIFSGCASGGRGVELVAVGGRAAATLSLGVQKPGRYAVRVGWLAGAAAPRLSVAGQPLTTASQARGPCESARAGAVWLGGGAVSIDLETDQTTRLDYVELLPAGAERPAGKHDPKRR
jgi:hypothetical protein